MAKPEWGTKRICLSCGARFYDFQKDPITCPACGTAFDPAAQSKPRRARAPVKVAPVLAENTEVETEVVDGEPEIEVEEDEDEETVAVAKDDDEEEEAEDESDSAIEDVSELGDDDMTDVIDTEIEDEETER